MRTAPLSLPRQFGTSNRSTALSVCELDHSDSTSHSGDGFGLLRGRWCAFGNSASGWFLGFDRFGLGGFVLGGSYIGCQPFLD